MDLKVKVACRFLYSRLILSMSLEEAKVTLGFPPNANPSSTEVAKAWKAKAFENHPDRGGNPAKMVEINVARDILEGKLKSYTPPPPPSGPEPIITESTFESAASKAGLPTDIHWVWVTEFGNFNVPVDLRLAGHPDTGWVAFGYNRKTMDYMFVAIAAGVYGTNLSNTWWVSKVFRISKDFSVSRAVTNGMRLVISQGGGRSFKGFDTNREKVYLLKGRKLKESDFSNPSGSSVSLAEWLKKQSMKQSMLTLGLK